jgi:hypothetical protein
VIIYDQFYADFRPLNTLRIRSEALASFRPTSARASLPAGGPEPRLRLYLVEPLCPGILQGSLKPPRNEPLWNWVASRAVQALRRSTACRYLFVVRKCNAQLGLARRRGSSSVGKNGSLWILFQKKVRFDTPCRRSGAPVSSPHWAHRKELRWNGGG